MRYNKWYTFTVNIDISKYVEIIVDSNEIPKNINIGEYENGEYVADKYFTADKIEELKQEFIKKIQESDNPFSIYCTDTDMTDYDKKLENKLFHIK